MPMHQKTPESMKSCENCDASPCQCYAKGGPTRDMEKGVNRASYSKPGVSAAGDSVRNANEYRRLSSKEEGIHGETQGADEAYHLRQAKRDHRKTIHEMRSMKKPELYAQGGNTAYGGTYESGEEKGINKRHNPDNARSVGQAGRDAVSGAKWERGRELLGYSRKSVHGELAREHTGVAKEKHRATLSEMKSMKKPNLYAKGGEVEGGSEDESLNSQDEDLHSIMGDELMSAFETKDKKKLIQSVEAMVRSCLNKE